MRKTGGAMRESLFLVMVVFLGASSLLVGISIGVLAESREFLAFESINANGENIYYDSNEIYLSSFGGILNEVAEEHEYDTLSYNCMNFSQSLKGRLTEDGYDAKVCYGSLRECEGAFCSHAWIKVEELYIEATTGQIISPSEYADKYEEKSCS